jgi:hypothetical protein
MLTLQNLQYICIVHHFYFIVVLTARTHTVCNITQQDAKHKAMLIYSGLTKQHKQVSITTVCVCINTEKLQQREVKYSCLNSMYWYEHLPILMVLFEWLPQCLLFERSEEIQVVHQGCWNCTPVLVPDETLCPVLHW